MPILPGVFSRPQVSFKQIYSVWENEMHGRIQLWNLKWPQAQAPSCTRSFFCLWWKQCCEAGGLSWELAGCFLGAGGAQSTSTQTLCTTCRQDSSLQLAFEKAAARIASGICSKKRQAECCRRLCQQTLSTTESQTSDFASHAFPIKNNWRSHRCLASWTKRCLLWPQVSPFLFRSFS